MAAIVETNGLDKRVLTAMLSVLTVGRVMHGETGLMTEGAGEIGRPVGFFSTLFMIGGLAAYGAFSSMPYWT